MYPACQLKAQINTVLSATKKEAALPLDASDCEGCSEHLQNDIILMRKMLQNITHLIETVNDTLPKDEEEFAFAPRLKAQIKRAVAMPADGSDFAGADQALIDEIVETRELLSRIAAAT